MLLPPTGFSWIAVALASSSVSARRTGSVIPDGETGRRTRRRGRAAGTRPGRPGCRRCPRSGCQAADGHQSREHPTARTRQVAMPGNATAELTAAAQTAKSARRMRTPAASTFLFRYHPERRGSGERTHTPRRSERLVLILQCRLAGTPDWQICHDRHGCMTPVAACDDPPRAWRADVPLASRCPRHPVRTQAGRYSVGPRRAAKPVAAPAGPALSAADIAAHYGQRPPHEGEQAAVTTVGRGDPVISGTPARRPAPATGGLPLHGLDDIKSTRVRHDPPSPAQSCPVTEPPPAQTPAPPTRHGPATSDGAGRIFLPQIRSRQRRP